MLSLSSFLAIALAFLASPVKSLNTARPGLILQTPEALNDVHQATSQPHSGNAAPAPLRVPVVLGVMSRCPDAVACEAVFDKVLDEVGDKVDIELTFIGRIDESEPNYGVTCLHGALECTGNIHELCVASRESQLTLSTAQFPRWWAFTRCLNAHYPDGIGIEEVSRKCALRSRIDWDAPDGPGECANSDEGVELLRESVLATQELGIKSSCTVVINGENVCVRDGEWRDCEGGHSVEDFVRQINEAYEDINGEIIDADWVIV